MQGRRWCAGLVALVLAGINPLHAGDEEDLVTLRVTDASGRPLAGAEVRLEAGGEPVLTGDDGEVRLRLPGPGAHRARVRADGFRAQSFRVALPPGDGPVVLIMEGPGFRQEVQVTGLMPELVSEDRLSRQAIDQGNSGDLATTLRYEPGLQAFQRGPVNLDPTVRGLQDAQVAVMVDGTRTFGAGPARMDSDLSHVSLHDVSSVRVVRGPYALAWGAGAMSAVQVETYRPEFSVAPFEMDGDAGLVYGENADTVDGHAAVGGSTTRIRWNASGCTQSGDDYEDGDGQRVEAGYRSATFRWGMGGKLGEGLTLDYTGGYQRQRDVDYPGRLLDAIFFETVSHALEARWGREGYLAEVYGQAYGNDKTHAMDNDDKPTAQADPGRMPPFPLNIELPTESRTAGARLHASFGRRRLHWKVGADYYAVDQSASREVTRRDTGDLLFLDIVWPDATTEDLGLYGQVTWTSDRYQVGGIVRGDRVDSRAGETSAFFLDHTEGSLRRTDTSVSGAVSGSISLSRRWTLEAGVGRAVRNPTHLELYSDRFPSVRFQTSAEFLGNPDLRPEASLQADLGTRVELGRLQLGIEGFWRRIEEYVTVVPDPTVPKRLPLSPDTVFRYVNGEATFRGGELRIEHTLPAGICWRGWASIVRGQDEELGEPVLGLPPVMGEVAVSYRRTGTGGFWMELGAVMAARQERVAALRGEKETAGWTVLNLRTSWNLTGSLQLLAGVDNLTDRQYADHLNALDPFRRERIPAPGRNGYLGVSYRF